MSPSPSSTATPSSATKGDCGRTTLIPLSWRTGGTDPSRERREARDFLLSLMVGEETAAGQGRVAGTGQHHSQPVRVGRPKGCRDTPQTLHSQGIASTITRQQGSMGGGFTPKPR